MGAGASLQTLGGNSFVLRISVPSLKAVKALKVQPSDTVWAVKKQLMDKLPKDLKEVLNHGLFIPPKGGKNGKFMEEKREIGSYKLEADENLNIDFIPKVRLQGPITDPLSPNTGAKRTLKKFFEDVQKGAADKVKERGAKGLDPNVLNENGETPLSIAVMNNDKNVISALIENGAFLDYRVSEKETWKTPLHMAAAYNKLQSLQQLLSFGAWPNAVDANFVSPLYYATANGHTECVQKLLAARADTETYDDTGRGPLHLACQNNYEAIVSLLIDYGAKLDVRNSAGNTPLHVAAARGAKNCAKLLLARGADRSLANSVGQTADQLAVMGGSLEICDMIKKFAAETTAPTPSSKPAPTESNGGASDAKQASGSGAAASGGNASAAAKTSRLGGRSESKGSIVGSGRSESKGSLAANGPIFGSGILEKTSIKGSKGELSSGSELTLESKTKSSGSLASRDDAGPGPLVDRAADASFKKMSTSSLHGSEKDKEKALPPPPPLPTHAQVERTSSMAVLPERGPPIPGVAPTGAPINIAVQAIQNKVSLQRSASSASTASRSGRRLASRGQAVPPPPGGVPPPPPGEARPLRKVSLRNTNNGTDVPPPPPGEPLRRANTTLPRRMVDIGNPGQTSSEADSVRRSLRPIRQRTKTETLAQLNSILAGFGGPSVGFLAKTPGSTSDDDGSMDLDFDWLIKALMDVDKLFKEKDQKLNALSVENEKLVARLKALEESKKS